MLNIIVNPTAGKGKALKSIKKVCAYLTDAQIPYTLYHTQFPGHATALAAEIKEGIIVAAGGDGTVSEVLTGISDFASVKLGIIPCGTGNDFPKFIGLPHDPVQALKLILKGSAKYTDFMQMGDRRALNVCGMGMDVTVLERCKRMKVFKGKLQYTLSLLITLLRFNWYNYRISIDGNTQEDFTGIIAAVANGKYFGGGIPISPDSSVDDGSLNLILINKMKKRRIPLALLSILRGNLLKFDFTRQVLCKSVVITPLSPESVNLDGEVFKDLSFDLTIISKTLMLFR